MITGGCTSGNLRVAARTRAMSMRGIYLTPAARAPTIGGSWALSPPSRFWRSRLTLPMRLLPAAQERARLAGEAFQLAQDLEQRALARVQTGLAPQLEAVQAGLARRRAAQERADRGAALASAREELGRLLGESDSTALEAAD